MLRSDQEPELAPRTIACTFLGVPSGAKSLGHMQRLQHIEMLKKRGDFLGVGPVLSEVILGAGLVVSEGTT